MVSEFPSSPAVMTTPPALPAAASTPMTSERVQLMRLFLGSDIPALLPVAQLAAVLSIPTGFVLPIPHLPPAILGIYNWRGEILWLVDLGQLLGFAPVQRSLPNHSVLVLQQSQSLPSPGATRQPPEKKLGLIVDRVEDVVWLEPMAIQVPLPTTAPELLPFLRGHWLPPEGDIHQVLDGDGIFAAMPQTGAPS